MGSTIYMSFILMLLFLYIACVGSFEITLLHTNNILSHFEETPVTGWDCVGEQAMDGECYGGIARRAAKVILFYSFASWLFGNVIKKIMNY